MTQQHTSTPSHFKCPSGENSPSTTQEKMRAAKQLRERIRNTRESATQIRLETRLAIQEARKMREEMKELLGEASENSLAEEEGEGEFCCVASTPLAASGGDGAVDVREMLFTTR